MIRFRMAEFVPGNGFGMCYVVNELATPEKNLTVIEPDEQDIGNIVDYFGNETDIRPASEQADTDDFVISNRSVISREVRRAIPLYYKYTVGRGVYDFYSRDAEDAASDKERLDAIRSRITILDTDNNATPAVKWDIEFTRVSTNRFTVVLYTDRRCSNGVTYKVRYPAIAAAGTIRYNMVEVINATPAVPDTDYTTTWAPGSGYILSNFSSGEYSPALAVFGNNVPMHVEADRITFNNNNSVSTVTGVSVEDLCADINALDEDVFATPLSNHDETGPLLVAGITWATEEGTVVRFNDVVHLRYNEGSRIFLERPYAANSRERWYPRINGGQYKTATGVYELYYKTSDIDYQPYSPDLGAPYRTMANEEPAALGNRIVQVSRYPLYSTGYISVYENGNSRVFSQAIDDVDLQNGILFLRQDYNPDARLAFSYTYEEKSYEYTDVDLNPVLNPSYHGKFVGIFMIPHLLESDVDVYQFDRTIYHTVQDTYQDVVDAVEALEISDGTPAFAVLLGVYHIVQKNSKEYLNAVDTRNKGGGLRPDVSPEDTQQPEADMYLDIGYWGGRPLQDRGTLIVEYPGDIIGTRDRYALIPESMPMDFASGWLIPSGFYDEEDVLAAAQKYSKAGALPILDRTNPTGTYISAQFEVYDPSNPGSEWSRP